MAIIMCQTKFQESIHSLIKYVFVYIIYICVLISLYIYKHIHDIVVGIIWEIILYLDIIYMYMSYCILWKYDYYYVCN